MLVTAEDPSHYISKSEQLYFKEVDLLNEMTKNFMSAPCTVKQFNIWVLNVNPRIAPKKNFKNTVSSGNLYSFSYSWRISLFFQR